MCPYDAEVIEVKDGCHPPLGLGEVLIFALNRVGPGHRTCLVAPAIVIAIDGREVGVQPKFPFTLQNFHCTGKIHPTIYVKKELLIRSYGISNRR